MRLQLRTQACVLSLMAFVPLHSLSGRAAEPSAEHVAAAGAGQRQQGLDGQRQQGLDGQRVRVVVLLRTRNRIAATARGLGPLIAPAPTTRERRDLLRFSPAVTLNYARQQEVRRGNALARLVLSGRRVARNQIAVCRAIMRSGGSVAYTSLVANTITAEIPRQAVTRLATRRDVEAVQEARPATTLDLGANSTAVGASTWWASGHSGGTGAADLPANFGLVQDPALASHPALAGITFERPAGVVRDPDPQATRHGTALLSAIASRGPSRCTLCQPQDVLQKGVAPGVSKVLDPTGSFAELDWVAGVAGYWRDGSTGVWSLEPGADDPAQVVNYSRGADSAADDSLGAQVWDATVDTYGVTATVAAGNSGPAARTVNDPALAYNVIGVGAFSGGGTTDPSDDSVFSWSSRGPTVGGRKKPDLVAVGDGGFAYSYFESTGKLWKYDTGTSYAAPQVGGGAILLAGAGIRDPKVVKAILIDSARPGRATPAESMGTQAGWQPDWGWGELNLDAAFRERLNFARGDAPANSARFFKATAQAPGDRATLVWNRRVADCKPLRQGCYYDTDSGFRVHSLSDLNLTEYDAATGIVRAASTSGVDNVEQVRAASPGAVVYKVSAGAIDGPSGEPFALAATRPLTPLVTPRPTIALTLDPSAASKSQTAVTVTATVANPSPDLSAEDAQVALTVPSGVELESGEQTKRLGTLQPNGSGSAQWTVRATSAGLKHLIATTTASRYGSAFGSSAVASLETKAPNPPPVGTTPPPPPTTPTPPIRPDDPPAGPPSPELTISTVRRRGARVTVRGTVARGANGRLTSTWNARARHRRYVARASTYAQLRRYRLTIKIPRRATAARSGVVVVTYLGTDGFARQTVRAIVR
jgi:serine protease AprX